jgi:hypothetical protein
LGPGVGSRIVTSAILRPRPPTHLFSSAYARARGQALPVHILSPQKSSRIHIKPRISKDVDRFLRGSLKSEFQLGRTAVSRWQGTSPPGCP